MRRTAPGRLVAASLAAVCFLGLVPAARCGTPLPERYRRWLNEEVVYLISDEERKAFLRLPSDAAREEFIHEFWEARNPARGTGRNPVKEEHYRRLDYANQHFGHESNTPGWKTDMGRTYILLGKPASRAIFKGYAQLYPMELWFYNNPTGNPSLPPFFYVLFYMPEGATEYRYFRPFLDGPLKLVRGTQFQTNRDVYEFLKPLGGDLARAVFSLVPGDPLDTQEFRPSIAGDWLIAKLQNYSNDPWEVRRVREARQLRAKVTSWFLVPDERPLETTVTVTADGEGEYWLDQAIWVDEESLGHPDGRGNLVVASGYRLFNQAGELVYEDSNEAAYPAYENGRFRPFLIARRLPLAPGRYRIELEVVNREAGRSRNAVKSVQAGDPILTEPVLASSVQPAGSLGQGAPFVFYGIQFVPSAERVFTPRDTLHALFQIQAKPDSSPDYEIDYVLTHATDRNMRRTWTEVAAGHEFRNGRLLKAKTISLADLEPGEYVLVIHLRPRGSPQVAASANVRFRVRSSRPDAALYIAGTPGGIPPGAAAYLRALAAISQNDPVRARTYLQAALRNGTQSQILGALAGQFFRKPAEP